ncbi:MAG: glutamate--tRNA ligase [Candidatus Nealsonbacteria bacterium]|nr:glutamate--tRNA ligase [Candidatus Nealsonbacteria bacterium]
MRSDAKFEFIKPGQMRTRFAPSPTGFFHVGSARAALFNYLFAKKYQGSFILRIEDTDVERSKPEFEQDIVDCLKWLGIEWDEFYRQSERKDIYKHYLEKLIEIGRAYYCFCSEEELEAKRQESMSRGLPTRYNGKCACLSREEIKKNLAQGKKSVIRFKIPSKKSKFNDLVRGEIEFDTGLIGDVSIARDINNPLYNLAVVVDDFEMKISHVIRGEDLLPNTPVQTLLQGALNFPQPEYAHLPLILGPDRSKLSKRQGAVALNEYKKDGYLPETLINFLAFLGWNPGNEREIYSLNSLIKDFSIKKVQKGGAIFNIKRLDYLNGFYIRQKSLEKLTGLCLPFLIQEGLIEPIFKESKYPPAYGGSDISWDYRIVETKKEISFTCLKKIIQIYQERLKKLSEIGELTDFFFREKLSYEKNLLSWKNMTNEEIKNSLTDLIKILSEIKKDSDWEKEKLENILMSEAEKAGDRGYFFWPFRVALSGKKASAGPFEIAEILGKEETLKRLKDALFKVSL